MVYIFLADGFEDIEALTTVDVLRRINVDIKTVSIKNEFVTTSHNITLKTDINIKDVDYDSAEMFVLPGGMPGTDNLEKCDTLKNILLKANEDKKYIAAICAAPKILGKLNILNNKEAICFPGYENDLLGATLSNKKVIKDGNIITAKGMGVSLDFALKIAEVLKGKNISDDVSKKLQYK